MIRVRDGEGIDSAIRRFRRFVEHAGILRDAKNHAWFTPPGERRREKARAARRRALRAAAAAEDEEQTDRGDHRSR